MNLISKAPKRGFTLLELMISVFIVGLLAAVAVPVLTRYMKRSKTTEALINLRKVYDGEVAYYQVDHLDVTGIVIDKQFVTCPATPPDVPGPSKTLGNWEDPAWQTINFSVDSPVYFRYSAPASGVGTQSIFTARAEGDLNGDGVTSDFERLGTVDPSTGDVVGGAAIYEFNALE